MKKVLLGIVCVLLLHGGVEAQKMIDSWAFTTGVDTTAWIDIDGVDSVLIASPASGQTIISANTGLVDIGFTFRLGNASHTSFSANINGTIGLDTALSASGYYQQPLGTNRNNSPKIEPFGARGRFAHDSYTRKAVVGAVGSRVLVIETCMESYSYSKRVTFQVQLFEDGSGIRIVYGASNDIAMNGTTQPGIVADASDVDILFLDMAAHQVSRIDGSTCTLTNAAGVWPDEGRWYRLAYDSNYCPTPPSVTTTGSDPTGIWLANSNGGVVDMRVRIPDMGIDTIWPQEESYLYLGGGFNPSTIYNGTVQGACDSGRASFRTRSFSFTTSCGPVEYLPWEVPFSRSNTCWNTAQNTGSAKYWRYVAPAMRCGISGSQNYNEWLVSPLVNLPDSEGISLQWDYRSTMSNNVAPTVDLRVAICDSTGTPVGTWDTLLTINTHIQQTTRQYLQLDAYRGERVKVAFVRTGTGGYYAYVENVALVWQRQPMFTLSAPSRAHVGDTCLIVCNMQAGVTASLLYAWHSSMLGDLTAADTLSIVYPHAGIDTVSLVLANSYGGDTLAAIVDVVDCRTVTSFPWNEGFEHGIDCWERPRSGQTVWTVRTTGAHSGQTAMGVSVINSATTPYDTLVSQPIAIPTDAHGLTLIWWMKRDANTAPNRAGRKMIVKAIGADGQGWDMADTLSYTSFEQFTTTYSRYTADLEPYAGDTVRIAFVGGSYESSRYILVDDIEIRYTRVPIAHIETDGRTCVGDTLTTQALLEEGDTAGLTYTWNSTMADRGLAQMSNLSSAQTEIVYTTGGTDTLTVTAANGYGVSYDTVVVEICPIVTVVPWVEDFDGYDTARYNVCWTLGGWQHIAANSGTSAYDEAGILQQYRQGTMYANHVGDYMLTPPIVIPETDVSNLDLWIECDAPLQVRVSTNASLDTADYTDTLLTVPIVSSSRNDMWWRTANISAYAGQTVRFGIFFKTAGNYALVNTVKVDYDTLPVLAAINGPSTTLADTSIVLTASLRRGSTDGLHYSWTSLLGGIITPNSDGDTITVFYPSGIGTANDTITVVAANLYGADTGRLVLHVIDCSPADTLPWIETFDDGIVCWYKPEGSKWRANQQNLYIDAQYDTLGSWIMSKPIAIPADTNGVACLTWKVASSVSTYRHVYSVLATTDSIGIDTMNYSLLYTDTAQHTSYSNYNTRSVRLDQYAGQYIRIAFHNQSLPLGVTNTTGLYIDNVTVKMTYAPMVELAASSPTYYYDDTVAIFTARLAEGGRNGLTFLFHSTMLDSTMTMVTNADTVTWTLHYPASGVTTDTVTVIATTVYGSDTARVVVTVNQCGPTEAAGWSENFTSVIAYNQAEQLPLCWRRYWNGSNAAYAPRVVSSYNYGSISGYYDYPLLMLAGLMSSLDTVSVVETPLFADTLNRLLLSLWYLHENANRGQMSVGYMQDNTFVSVDDLAPQSAGLTDTVSLASIPADVHRLAIQWKLTNDYKYGVAIDNLLIFERDTMPKVRLLAPSSTYMGDTTAFTAELRDGVTDSLHYIWHSTLMDSTWTTHGTDGVTEIVYTVGGTDTLSVVATNAFGSDTARAIVNVNIYPLPQITLTASDTIAWFYNLPSVAVAYTTTVNGCSRNGLTFTWHSTLLDSSYTHSWESSAPSWTLNYYAAGIDTVTLIASNVHGSDTAQVIVRVFNCGATALPYYEDFEDVAPTSWMENEGNMPTCWLIGWTGSSTNARLPYIVSSYHSISITSNALLMMAGRDANCRNWVQVELPRFAQPLNELILALDYCQENATNGILSVGYFDETLLTYTPVDTLEAHTGSYLRDTVRFLGLTPPEGALITLRFYNTVSHYGVAIDNVAVFVNDALTNLTVDSIGASCVSLSWSPSASASAYVVSVDGVGDTVVVDTNVTLCGLYDNTDYEVRVAALMGGDTSNYVSATFHTLLLCAPVVNTHATIVGDSLVVGWQYDTTGCSAPTGARVVISDLTLGGTERVDTIMGTDTTWTVSFIAGHSYAVSVHALCGSATAHESDTVVVHVAASVCDEMRGTYTDNSNFFYTWAQRYYSQALYPASFVATVDTLFGIAFRVATSTNRASRVWDVYLGHTSLSTLTTPIGADSLTLVANDYVFPVGDTGWVRIMFDTPFAYDGSSNLVVTIDDNTGAYSNGLSFGANNAIGGNLLSISSFSMSTVSDPDPYTLNFETESNLRKPDIQLLGGCQDTACLSPMVATEGTTAGSITLGWVRRGVESLWQIEYRSSADAPWVVADTTRATTYTIGGLMPSTLYQVRVAALCSGDTLYGDPLSVSTSCDTVGLPYRTDFTLGHQPCWIEGGYYGGDFTGIRISGREAYYPLDSIVSPVVSASLSDAMVTIWVVNPRDDSPTTSYASSLAVGVANADGSGAVWIDTVPILSRHVVEEHTVYLAGYTGSAHNVIIRVIGGLADVQSVTIDYHSSCLPPSHLGVAQFTDTSTTIQWTTDDSIGSFAVYLDNTLWDITSASSYTFAPLLPDTQYTASVRKICSPGDTSEAVRHLFHTPCAVQSLPLFEDFNYALNDDHSGLPDCWYPQFFDNNAIAYGLSTMGYTLLMLECTSNADSTVGNYAISPMLNVGARGAIVRFKGQASFHGDVTVGVMTDISDTSTFIPCVSVSQSNTGLRWYQFSTENMALPDVWSLAVRFSGNRTGIFDSLYVDAIPVPEYRVTLSANDTAMGTVTGDGIYQEGAVATITAVPYTGYRFDVWSDGDTTNPRTLLVTSDTVLVAYFSIIDDSLDIDYPQTTDDLLRLYPNPTTGMVTIESSQATAITLIDIYGRKVVQMRVDTGHTSLDLSRLPRGIYFVRIDGSSIVKKLVLGAIEN